MECWLCNCYITGFVWHAVRYKTIKLDRNNQQIYSNWVRFLKIYIFIYRTYIFRLFPSHHQNACYMVQRKNNVYIIQDKIISISVLQAQFTVC
jgi:hypothetical protein